MNAARLTVIIGILAALAVSGAQAADQTVKDIAYAKVEGKPVLLDLYLPEKAQEPAPVVIRLSNRREKPAEIAQGLLAKGYAVAMVSYLPGEPDTFYSGFPRDIHAAKAAVRFLRANAGKYGLDDKRLGVWGMGAGSSIAALMLANTGELEGNLGDTPQTSSRIQALCLVNGTTDWRNAELYGDETVNDLRGPGYELFGTNVKAAPAAARAASAINYVRPTSPPVLMVATDLTITPHQYATWAETLKRAGVPSGYVAPQHPGERLANGALAEPIVKFFDERLKAADGSDKRLAMSPEDQVTALTKAGLYKQARQIIDENMSGTARDQWRKLLVQLSDSQAEAAVSKLQEARKSGDLSAAARIMWSVREVVIDPARLGQYQVQAINLAMQAEYDQRANVERQIALLNTHVQRGEWVTGDRLVKQIVDLAKLEGKESFQVAQAAANRYRELRAHPEQVWPEGTRPVGWAAGFGRDLYGHFMDMRIGGVVQRFRYVPPGRFRMGSPKDEWGRQPEEADQVETEIKDGFWLAETECTQGFWEAVMGKNANQSHFKGDPSLPVENVGYQHVVNFMEKLGVGARLPSQEEFEYACRAGSSGPVAGTGRLTDIGWYWDESEDAGRRGGTPVLPELKGQLDPKQRSTHAVKTKLPNAWGLYDMEGNVWEWCSGSSPVQERTWHVARGGGWNSIPESCRPARFAWHPTEHESWNLGFRIVIPAGK